MSVDVRVSGNYRENSIMYSLFKSSNIGYDIHLGAEYPNWELDEFRPFMEDNSDEAKTFKSLSMVDKEYLIKQFAPNSVRNRYYVYVAVMAQLDYITGYPRSISDLGLCYGRTMGAVSIPPLLYVDKNIGTAEEGIFAESFEEQAEYFEEVGIRFDVASFERDVKCVFSKDERKEKAEFILNRLKAHPEYRMYLY